VAAPPPDYETSGNALLVRLYGAHLHPAAWSGDRNTPIQQLAARLRAEGRNRISFLWRIERARCRRLCQHRARDRAAVSTLGFEPAAIVHCSGSGATQAGLVVGASRACRARA